MVWILLPRRVAIFSPHQDYPVPPQVTAKNRTTILYQVHIDRQTAKARRSKLQEIVNIQESYIDLILNCYVKFCNVLQFNWVCYNHWRSKGHKVTTKLHYIHKIKIILLCIYRKCWILLASSCDLLIYIANSLVKNHSSTTGYVKETNFEKSCNMSNKKILVSWSTCTTE